MKAEKSRKTLCKVLALGFITVEIALCLSLGPKSCSADNYVNVLYGKKRLGLKRETFIWKAIFGLRSVLESTVRPMINTLSVPLS